MGPMAGMRVCVWPLFDVKMGRGAMGCSSGVSTPHGPVIWKYKNKNLLVWVIAQNWESGSGCYRERLLAV